MNDRKPLLAIFAYLDDLLVAIRAMQGHSIEISDVHSPALNEEITAALGEKRSPVRFFTLCGGILGIITGFGLSVYTAMQWHFIVSGKPPVPRVPYVIESFEFCILLSVCFNLGGMLLLSRLPKFKLPSHYDARCTEDRFSMLVRCPAPRQREISQMLQEAGAEEIRDFD
jgi:hypothetical protein